MPPGPVKISHKKDGYRSWLHKFHVSRPPLPGRWIRYCRGTGGQRYGLPRRSDSVLGEHEPACSTKCKKYCILFFFKKGGII